MANLRVHQSNFLHRNKCPKHQSNKTIILAVCLSVGVRKLQVAILARSCRGDVSNCSYRLTVHPVTSTRLSSALQFFNTRKSSKTSWKSDHQRACLFEWPATGIVVSGAGRHGWAPPNSNSLYGGGVCVHTCVRMYLTQADNDNN